MTLRIDRRKLLQLPIAASGLGLGLAPARAALPDPREAPFDTVVVLMLENRSFDHLLGWLPGANGRQAGLAYLDKAGTLQPTFPLYPDFQGCGHDDPEHTWQAIKAQYAGGRCDGWLQTPASRPGDNFAIGYYREGELPVLAALAKGYTTFDSYFCSMMGPTWENRLYQLSGTTQLMENCDFPRDGEERPVSIVRGEVASDDVVVSRLKSGVVVVRVSEFTRGVGAAVRKAVDDASLEREAPEGVVLDLRGNPGGLLTEAVEVASAFLEGGTVVSYEKRGEPVRHLDAVGDGNTLVPLVVLVDAGTASASEVVAAALQDRNRAVIVGGRTYGKGSVQEPRQLSDGSAIELTVGRYLTPSGRSLDGVGIEPDVVVSARLGAATAEQRALEVLLGLVAASDLAERG